MLEGTSILEECFKMPSFSFILKCLFLIFKTLLNLEFILKWNVRRAFRTSFYFSGAADQTGDSCPDILTSGPGDWRQAGLKLETPLPRSPSAGIIGAYSHVWLHWLSLETLSRCSESTRWPAPPTLSPRLPPDAGWQVLVTPWSLSVIGIFVL